MKVYLASPFFSETERTDYFEALAILRGRGLCVYAPLLHQRGRCGLSRREWAEATFQDDLAALQSADIVVMFFMGCIRTEAPRGNAAMRTPSAKRSSPYICTAENPTA